MSAKKTHARKPGPPLKMVRASTAGRITNKEMFGAALQRLQQDGIDAAIDYLAGLDAHRGADHRFLAERLTALGHVVQQHDPKTALALAEKAIELSADCIAAWVLAGGMQDRLGQRGRSALSLIHVVQSERANPDQVLNAASLLVRFGQQAIALETAKAAFDKLGKPLHWVSTLLYIAQRTADWALVDALTSQLRDAYAKGMGGEANESPRTHLLWCSDVATNIKVVQQWSAKAIALPSNVSPPAPLPLEGRRLRVGYLSSDFWEHPTSRLINGLLRHHDRTRFELFMYCSGWDDASPLRKEIESRFDHVHAVAQLGDAAAADLIRSHAIDVLVELNGPTRANRLGILAHRPAPVQIDYLGWPGSIGGRVVDYVVGDRYTIPAGAEKLYPEKVIFIEQTYQVNDYATRARPVALTRKQAGLPEGDWRVLGMFNAINKVHGAAWDVWMRILKAVPNALLWLLDPGPTALKHIAHVTVAHGVDPRRIVIAPRLPQDAHLARLQCCDLMLDPWPYGGHTSTSDALFAGVPVVTLEGTNFASRVSGGLLRAAGLEMLVQPNASAYARVVVDLLRNPQKLSGIKQFIAEQVPHSDVFNARSKARQLEAAYEQAIKWRIGNLPLQTLAIHSHRPASVQTGNAGTLRIAVVTPYWRESDETLAKCMASVRQQAYPVTHFLVADGMPKTLPEQEGVIHVALPVNTGNSGATPRGVGAQLAFNMGFDAVAFLDADNWYEPDHIGRVVQAIEQCQPDVVFARRKIVFPDGEVLQQDDPTDARALHVDTNCFVLTRRAAFLAAVWLMWPKAFGAGEDRLMRRAVAQYQLKSVLLDKPTVWYVTNWSLHYKLADKLPVAPLRKPTKKATWNFHPETFRQHTGMHLAFPQGRSAAPPPADLPAAPELALVVWNPLQPLEVRIHKGINFADDKAGEVLHLRLPEHDAMEQSALGLGAVMAFQSGADIVVLQSGEVSTGEARLNDLVMSLQRARLGMLVDCTRDAAVDEKAALFLDRPGVLSATAAHLAILLCQLPLGIFREALVPVLSALVLAKGEKIDFPGATNRHTGLAGWGQQVFDPREIFSRTGVRLSPMMMNKSGSPTENLPSG